jgi:hypothetical protein
MGKERRLPGDFGNERQFVAFMLLRMLQIRRSGRFVFPYIGWNPADSFIAVLLQYILPRICNRLSRADLLFSVSASSGR